MTDPMPTGEHAAVPEQQSKSVVIAVAAVVSLLLGLGGLAGGVGGYFVLGYRVDQLEKQVATEQHEHAARVAKDAANDTALALFAQKLDTVAGDVRDIKRAMKLSPRTARDDGP